MSALDNEPTISPTFPDLDAKLSDTIRLCRFRPWVVWWDPTPPSRFRWTSSLWRRWTKTSNTHDMHLTENGGTFERKFPLNLNVSVCFFLKMYVFFDVPLLKGCWNDFAPGTGKTFIVSPIHYLQKRKEKVSWNLSQDLMRITLSWDSNQERPFNFNVGWPRATYSTRK